MDPWSIDAREAIKDLSDIDVDFVEETDDIGNFLRRDRYRFIIATKGLGKSLLLIVKRKNLKGVDCVIPKGRLLDVPVLSIDTFSRDQISFLYEEETMEKLWTISIIIAVINNLDLSDEILKKDISKSLRYIIKEEASTISGNMGEILRSTNRKEFYQGIMNDYNKLTSFAQMIDNSVAAFIDNVDECFENLVAGFGRDMWYIAQDSLIRAIYKLVRLNPKFKFYASIRKEAFLKMKQSTEMYQQYKGVSLDLKYHKEELKEIFIKNIKKEENKNLLYQNLLRTDPIRSFLGTDTIHHGYVNENENIFDFIYRHTLQRPRDFMEMGHALSACPIAERNPSTEIGTHRINFIVNETATIIANTYISEILPHLRFRERSDLDKIFGFIDSNVLDQPTIKQICMLYNEKYDCLTKNCKLCKDKTHIFCELYKIGLLGFVEEDPSKKGAYRQQFCMVGERTFDDTGILPDSSYYLVHPILDELIRGKNKSYKEHINDINIIGHYRPWITRNMVLPEASQHVQEQQETSNNRFICKGDYWIIQYKGEESLIKNAKGVKYIAHLLDHQGKEIDALKLIEIIPTEKSEYSKMGQNQFDDYGLTSSHDVSGTDQEVIDDKAMSAYKERLDDLRTELAEAERDDNIGLAAHHKEEIASIFDVLKKTLNNKGKSRKFPNHNERVRQAVSKAIHGTMKKFKETCPILHAHLDKAISTGNQCKYVPNEPTKWTIEYL